MIRTPLLFVIAALLLTACDATTSALGPRYDCREEAVEELTRLAIVKADIKSLYVAPERSGRRGGLTVCTASRL